MKTPLARRWLALALALGVAAPACAQHYLIAHPGTQLTPAEVREVFLGEKQFAGSTKLAPADNLAAQEEFVARFLNLDKVKYVAVWTKKAFRDGLVQPPMKSGDGEVLDFVRRTPGAVGYVRASPAGVNVLHKY